MTPPIILACMRIFSQSCVPSISFMPLFNAFSSRCYRIRIYSEMSMTTFFSPPAFFLVFNVSADNDDDDRMTHGRLSCSQIQAYPLDMIYHIHAHSIPLSSLRSSIPPTTNTTRILHTTSWQPIGHTSTSACKTWNINCMVFQMILVGLPAFLVGRCHNIWR